MNDPQELHNPIGRNPDRKKHRVEAARMKGLLAEWLTRAKSPHWDKVKARAVFAAVRADATVSEPPANRRLLSGEQHSMDSEKLTV